MSRLRVVCLVLASAFAGAARPDTSPPVISLALPELADGVAHISPNVPTLDAEAARTNSQRNRAGHRSVTCEVGTTAADAASCPEPTCKAHDHHDGELPCSNTYILVNRDNTVLDPSDQRYQSST